MKNAQNYAVWNSFGESINNYQFLSIHLCFFSIICWMENCLLVLLYLSNPKKLPHSG